jgi:cytochrome c oxidase subunit 3
LAQPDVAAAPAHAPGLAHHFNSLRQQRAAGELGMWVFLVTEFMFFGGLFLAYLIYREQYSRAFAEGSHSMNLWLGTLNTAVLLTSSLTMALAVHAAEESAERGREARSRRLVQFLLGTIALGLVFLGIKGFEYYDKYLHDHIPFGGFTFSQPDNPGLETFFNLYFLMTGFHALHMVIGIAILLLLVRQARRWRLTEESSIIVYNFGLYWHFVDLVWVYLFPFFYLVGARISGTSHG